MLRLTQFFKLFLLLTASLLCLALVHLCLSAERTLQTTETAIRAIPPQIEQLTLDTENAESQTTAAMAALNETLAGVGADVHSTAQTLNGSLAGISSDVHSTSQALNAGIANTTASTETTLAGLQADTDALHSVLSDDDIPKLVRDARQTIAITGHTMSHIESTANTIAAAAPEMAQNTNGIAADIHTLTSDITKPKPLWKKILSVFTDAAALRSLF